MNRNEFTKFKIGAISDTQERKGTELHKSLDPLKQAEDNGLNLDFIVHIGDLSESGMLSKYVKRAKELSAKLEQEVDGQINSPELADYKNTIESEDFKRFADDLMLKGYDAHIVHYALWSANINGDLENALADMEKLTRDVTDLLGDFKSKVVHIMGNADRGFPQKLDLTEKLLREKGIESYDKPLNLPLDNDTAIIMWPSFQVDEKNDKDVHELEDLINDFVAENKDKKSVLIFAHEAPFKGPQTSGIYEKRANNAGLEKTRPVSFKHYLPASRYLMELCRRLPASVDITMTCGHVHVSREHIEASTRYLKFDETGKTKLRLLGGKDIDRSKHEITEGKKRTIDLYYLPEGEVGYFDILENGDINYTKLTPENKSQTTEKLSKEKNNPKAWDKIYDEQSPAEIPWNFENIPAWFIEIIESGWIKPGKTLDVGCGLGNYSNYLAENGFDVLGVDFSKEAVAKDRKKFQKDNLRFEECDALNLKIILDKEKPEMFDFVIDISLLHHIKPEARKKYADSVASVTKSGSKVLISCFSESDPVFEGQKAFHNPDTDTVTYVLSKDDIINTFSEQFEIEELNEVEFGKFSKIGNSMTRKRHLVKLIRK